MLGNAEIGHDTQYFPQNPVFCFRENRLPENLTAIPEYRCFMDKPDEGEIIALAAKVGRTAGDLNKYPTELSGGMAKQVAFLRLLLCGCDLAGRAVRSRLDRDLRDIWSPCWWKNQAAGARHYQSVITCLHTLIERDSAFEETVVAREFQGFIIIMSDRI